MCGRLVDWALRMEMEKEAVDLGQMREAVVEEQREMSGHMRFGRLVLRETVCGRW